MAARAILIVRVDNATVVRESLNRHPCDGGGRLMRRAKNSISTAVAGIGLALVTACLAAAPVASAPPTPEDHSASAEACPQAPAPFMVDGTAPESAVTVADPTPSPEGASPDATCVPPTL